MVEAAKASARENLPKAGGLNTYIADDAKIAVRNRVSSARSVGVRIVATEGGVNLTRMDKGAVRHPVYGNRKVWVEQSIADGWFTKPLNKLAPVAQAEITMALNIIGRRLEKGIY